MKVKRYLKAIANVRPSKPRYSHIWDTKPLLSYLEKLYPYDGISLGLISIKLATLLVLITGHRIQTIAAIKINNIIESQSGFQIFISDKIKTSGVNRCQPCLQVPNYYDNPSLCVAKLLKKYIEVTESFRNNGQEYLFLTTRPPYSRASKQTISNWVKTALSAAGIDTKFKPHSTRHASTSKAFSRGISIEVIRKTAGWTENSSTFAKFYQRPIVETTAFAEAILQE